MVMQVKGLAQVRAHREYSVNVSPRYHGSYFFKEDVIYLRERVLA